MGYWHPNRGPNVYLASTLPTKPSVKSLILNFQDYFIWNINNHLNNATHTLSLLMRYGRKCFRRTHILPSSFSIEIMTLDFVDGADSSKVSMTKIEQNECRDVWQLFGCYGYNVVIFTLSGPQCSLAQTEKYKKAHIATRVLQKKFREAQRRKTKFTCNFFTFSFYDNVYYPFCLHIEWMYINICSEIV